MPSKFRIRVAEPSITDEDTMAMYKAVKETYLSSGPYVEKYKK